MNWLLPIHLTKFLNKYEGDKMVITLDTFDNSVGNIISNIYSIWKLNCRR